MTGFRLSCVQQVTGQTLASQERANEGVWLYQNSSLRYFNKHNDHTHHPSQCTLL